MTYFPEEVVENILSFIGGHRDRNVVSCACKAWYHIERLTRKSVFIGNCYAVRPERVCDRFPKLKSLTVKGKPHFADFNMVPHAWGGFASPWIKAFVQGCTGLEEIRLKRMVVSDDDLELLARSFPNFKSVVLDCCDGFSTNGLASIVTHCRSLRVLELQECEVEDNGSRWLSCFPESSTSLESLNFACLKGEVDTNALEKLVARSPNLRSLRLSSQVSADAFSNILTRAPNLVDLGTGSFIMDPVNSVFPRLLIAFRKCKSLSSMSGFWCGSSRCLILMRSVCPNLTVLNLSYAPTIPSEELTEIVRQCPKLQCLWILDTIGDKGLGVVASTCKDLEELRVFPSNYMNGENSFVTEQGLVSISVGCRKLKSLLFFCDQLTNAALVTVANNCPNFISFRICIIQLCKPDPLTYQPLDEGFGAIVRSCKNLRRLSLSGLLTDQVFLYIGMYAENLEMLSVAFAGDSDKGMEYVLNGCKNLKKLEIRNSPFGDAAILEDVEKYETMRSLWMSSCDVTLGGAKTLAAKMRGVNVEVMEGENIMEEETDKVGHLYAYRTLAGVRNDAPEFVLKL